MGKHRSFLCRSQLNGGVQKVLSSRERAIAHVGRLDHARPQQCQAERSVEAEV